MTEAEHIRHLADGGVLPNDIAAQLSIPRSAVVAAMRGQQVRGPKGDSSFNPNFDYVAFRAEVQRRREEFEEDLRTGAPYIREFLKTWKENGVTPGRMSR